MNQFLNSQITEAVALANISVVAMAPAMSMGNLYMTLSNSVSMAAMNAVFAQQQANIMHQASTVQGTSHLLTAPTGV